MAIKILSAALVGVEAEIIEIEASAGGGDFGQIIIVGLPDAAVSEAKERVRSALLNSGYGFPKRKITVNLAPADLRKSGPTYDLPIALSIICLKNSGYPALESSLVAGELSLSGELRAISGAVPMAAKAKEQGLSSLFLPSINAAEAAYVTGITIFPINNLKELVDHLKGKKIIQPYCAKKTACPPEDSSLTISDIKGQENAKRALEIAVAGGHNLLMSGPPGSGKTMLALAARSLLPPLSERESLEIAKIYSAYGQAVFSQKTGNFRFARPFRSPHHSISTAALIGGGRRLRPGEISLAHLGVLFLDEFPEFSRTALESLRQPLEAGSITISRAAGCLDLPARFMLIAAMNPCPCGLRGTKNKSCHCSADSIRRYRQRISGPILDRIDLHIEVPCLNPADFHKAPSLDEAGGAKERIKEARVIQHKRLNGLFPALNSNIPSNKLLSLIKLDPETQNFLIVAAKNLNLSNRSYFRVLKIARTIADLEKELNIDKKHLAEALRYRPRTEID